MIKHFYNKDKTRERRGAEDKRTARQRAQDAKRRGTETPDGRQDARMHDTAFPAHDGLKALGGSWTLFTFVLGSFFLFSYSFLYVECRVICGVRNGGF